MTGKGSIRPKRQATIAQRFDSHDLDHAIEANRRRWRQNFRWSTKSRWQTRSATIRSLWSSFGTRLKLLEMRLSEVCRQSARSDQRSLSLKVEGGDLAATIRFSPDPERPGATILNTEMVLPGSIERVFDFFSDASNLESITPPSLRFRIETPKPIPMLAGTLIDYRLNLHYIPIRWRTEISDWNPPYRFVDRQLRGPYRRWVHTHEFSQCSDGIVVRDSVSFVAPGGNLIRKLFVQPELVKIFQYRHQLLAEIFDVAAPSSAISLNQERSV